MTAPGPGTACVCKLQNARCRNVSSRGPAAEDSALSRRTLRLRLRQLRETAGLTQKEAADLLYWSAAKMSRIESGQVSVRAGDLRELCHIYAITDQQLVEQLLGLAHASRSYGQTPHFLQLDDSMSSFVQLEASAAEISAYEPHTVPGMLQTDEYARALVAARGADEAEQEVAAQIAHRRRGHIVEGGARVYVLLDETAALRTVGSETIMLTQLDELAVMAACASVRIQVVPDNAQNVPLSGPIYHLTFHGETPDACLTYDAVRSRLIDEVASVEKLAQTFHKAAAGHAWSPETSSSWLNKQRARRSAAQA